MIRQSLPVCPSFPHNQQAPSLHFGSEMVDVRRGAGGGQAPSPHLSDSIFSTTAICGIHGCFVGSLLGFPTCDCLNGLQLNRRAYFLLSSMCRLNARIVFHVVKVYQIEVIHVSQEQSPLQQCAPISRRYVAGLKYSQPVRVGQCLMVRRDDQVIPRRTFFVRV